MLLLFIGHAVEVVVNDRGVAVVTGRDEGVVSVTGAVGVATVVSHLTSSCISYSLLDRNCFPLSHMLHFRTNLIVIFSLLVICKPYSGRKKGGS